MNSNTKQFIYDIQQRKNNYMEDVLTAIQHPKKEQSVQVIQNIVEKMDMMISLVTTYMTIETESMKELKELQEEIIHAQAYIQKRKFEETQR
ncbi:MULTISPECIES: hypothetical protein [Bacillus cereus group]|uniref:hypothetical protein n=1 Tax=Bacillus cereus group TaxID=86661 RepID=UPI000BF5D2E1|nr:MULTISPECIES: hypothetical protein [Bacillus cereus group]KAA0767612.1 hypothetical protein DT250_18210 [Bacillus sp. AR2-1]PES54550.1 hypothetical protein CN499_07735 [Bacillus thuringiensis]PET97574.1 hypothetical protein CN534_20325 [Bacillus cereus]PEZ52899.1 hypothetical protein CN370_29615 [Bacillus cereus]PFB57498.1 hypothetical protein CN292_30840 [Bacillus cereus]